MSNDQNNRKDTMTDQTDDTTADTKPEESIEAGTEQDTGNPNKEAAKYRRQLRDVEAERDTLTGKVEVMQRAMIENEVQRAGYKPAAFWSRDANTPASFFGDDGTLDAEALAEAITTTADELGLKGKARGPHAPKEGGTSRARASKSWDSAFRAQTS